MKVVMFTEGVLNDVRARVNQAGVTFISKPCDPKLVALQLAGVINPRIV